MSKRNRRSRNSTRSALLPHGETVSTDAGAKTRRTPGRRLRRTWNPRQLVIYSAVALALVGGLVLLVKSAGAPSDRPLPGGDFRIVAYQGEEVLGGHDSKFSNIAGQGKPVVLNFFAGQCPPCRAEMPGFQRVADEFQGKVIFVGVDIGPYLNLGSHDDAKALLADLKMRYPAAYAPDSSPLSIFSIEGMPTTIILDAKGRQVDKHTGIFTEAQLREKLKPLVSP